MRRWVVAFLLGLLGCSLAAAPLARAEGVVEVYRSTHGWARAVAVNPNDGSCWAIFGVSVLHLDAAGNLLRQFTDFEYPLGLAVNTQDGSCWVADPCRSEVIHLAWDGTVLWRGGSCRASYLSVNPADGSVWVSTCDRLAADHDVIHLAADGREISRLQAVTNPAFVAASPLDGSCWVMDCPDGVSLRLKHLAEDGTPLWEGTGGPFSLNTSDGSVWVSAYWSVYHLSADHQVLWTHAWQTALYPGEIAANSADGSCWYQRAPGACDAALVHVDPDGQELLRLQGSEWTLGWMALDASDGSIWATADAGLLHLGPDGNVLWNDRRQLASAFALNPNDGSYWFTGMQCPHNQYWIARYDQAGTEVWQTGTAGFTYQLVADQADGSCWALDDQGLQHFAADGQILPWNGDPAASGNCLALDPQDRSLWLAGDPVLFHLTKEGERLSLVDLGAGARALRFSPYDRSVWVIVETSHGSEGVQATCGLRHVTSEGIVFSVGDPQYPRWLSVNPDDGTVWVTDCEYDANLYRVFHVSPEGTILWQSEPADAQGSAFWYVAVDPTSGDCWVVGPEVRLFSAEGAELGRTDVSNFMPYDAVVNPADGVCWIPDDYSVLRKMAVASPFPDIAADSWAALPIRACVAADIVGGYPDGDYHPETVVTRDQMAVFIARALTGGSIPPGPALPAFSDVPLGFWAYDAITYAASQRIVSGYPGGHYHPSLPVDRAQMAAFIARALAPFSERPLLPSYTPPPIISFPDVPSWNWAYRYVEYVKAAGVVAGYPDHAYHPELPCTRDQMAVFISRAFDLRP